MKSLPPTLRKRRGGLFLLYGEDEYRKAEAERELVNEHLDPSTRDFNYDMVRGADAKPEALLAVLGTPPMMATWRVVVLRETQALASKPRLRTALLGVAKKPPVGLALIMNYSLARGRPPKFFVNLRRASASAEFRHLGEHELPDWISDHARNNHGKSMDPEAARGLAAAIGTDLGILAQEIEKLAEVATGDTVTFADVKAAGTRIPSMDQWKWLDLVGERSFEAALTSLPHVLHQARTGRTVSVVGLVGTLATHFLRLGLAKEAGPGRLAAILPPNQTWLAKRVGRQARRWRSQEIESALDGLVQLDVLLKASPHTETHFLEEWILARMAQRTAA